MRWLVEKAEDSAKVAQIIRAAGGRVVGRTRLQKMFYLLEAAGYNFDFTFEYRHYGPYSEKLTRATSIGSMEGILQEEEYAASWGGTYSVFTAAGRPSPELEVGLQSLVEIANKANPIDLELAATAIFLSKQDANDPWAETIKRKPDKAKRIGTAKTLLQQLAELQLPTALPKL